MEKKRKRRETRRTGLLLGQKAQITKKLFGGIHLFVMFGDDLIHANLDVGVLGEKFSHVLKPFHILHELITYFGNEFKTFLHAHIRAGVVELGLELIRHDH